MESQAAQDLLANRDLGASALLLKFCSLLPTLSEQDRTRLLAGLKQRFPLMAVWHFAEDWFQATPTPVMKASAFMKLIAESQAETLRRAVSELGSYQCFATLSRSSLVERTLIQLGQRKPIRVVSSRSLPAEEGLGLHHALRENGIASHCVSDWELLDKLAGVEVVILGADWVSKTEFINKWGSRALAIWASETGTPLIVVAESFKHRAVVSWPAAGFYQNWSLQGTTRLVKVFEVCPLPTGSHVV